MGRRRRAARLRIDPFRDPRAAATTALDLILDAEEDQPDTSGRRKLEVVSTALAALIDLPLIPEALEVVLARVIVQFVFGTIEDINVAVRARRERREAGRGAN